MVGVNYNARNILGLFEATGLKVSYIVDFIDSRSKFIV